MQSRIFLLAFSLILNITFLSAQEEWVVPADKKDKLSTFEFTDVSNQKGAEIFSTNCASCHGQVGQNNFVPLVPEPGDPAGEKFQINTDGELYHKIREGRGTMPSFKNTLTPDDVWMVVSYFRSFNDSYSQEVATAIERGVFDGDVAILLNYIEEEHLIQASVTGTKNGISEAIPGAEVKLLVERMFGSLQLDEAKITNKEGVVSFSSETDLPGDSLGYLKLIAQLTDQEAFGVVNSEALLPIGQPSNNPSLVAERAMWNTSKKAPLWIMLSYLLAVAAAWGTIMFIMFQLKKIFEIGKAEEEK